MSSWQPPHTHTTHVTRPVDTRIQYMLLANTCKKHWTEAWNTSGIKTKFEVGTPGSLLQLCLQRTYLQPSNQGLFVLWPVPSGGALRPCCREQHKPRWLQLDYMTVLLPRNTEPGYCSASLSPPSWTLIFCDRAHCAASHYVPFSLSLSPTPSVFYSLLRHDWIFVLVDLKEKKLKCHLHSDWFTFFPFWVDEHSQTVDKRPSVCLKTQRAAHLQQI